MGDNPTNRSVRRDKVCDQIDVTKLFVDGKMLPAVQAENLNSLLVNSNLIPDFKRVFNTIQAAIDRTLVLGTSKLIFVAPGTYTEDVTVTAPSNFTLQGLVDSSHGSNLLTLIDGTFTIPHNGRYRFSNIAFNSVTSATATHSLVITSDAIDGTSVNLNDVFINTPTGGAGVEGMIVTNTGNVSAMNVFIDNSDIDGGTWTGTGTGRTVVSTSNSRYNGPVVWDVSVPAAGASSHLYEFTQGTRFNGSLIMAAISVGEIRLADTLFLGDSKIIFDGSAGVKVELHACSFQMNQNVTSPIISVESCTAALFAITYSTISAPPAPTGPVVLNWIESSAGGNAITVHEVTVRRNDNSIALTNGSGATAVAETNSVGVINPA